MKFITCKELGESFCDFQIDGETDTEVKDEMFDHLETEHSPDLMTDNQIRKIEKRIDRILIYQD